jgi:hypothetical protein
VPYPKTLVHFAPDTMGGDNPDCYQRVFLGQLPYGVTAEQLQWLSQIFGGGVTLYGAEVVMKSGKKTGCIHARVHEAQLKQLVAGLHKRVLVDDTGVWYGRTPAEIQCLAQYCAELKADCKKRYPDRPYDTIVVQNATSSATGAHHPQNHMHLPTAEEYFAAMNGIY